MMSALWGYTKYPLYLFSSVFALAGSALYYYQKSALSCALALWLP